MKTRSALLLAASSLLVACGSGIVPGDYYTDRDDSVCTNLSCLTGTTTRGQTAGGEDNNGRGNTGTGAATGNGGAGTKTCNDLRGCCTAQTDMELKQQCDAYVTAANNADATCNSLYATFKAGGYCP